MRGDFGKEIMAVTFWDFTCVRVCGHGHEWQNEKLGGGRERRAVTPRAWCLPNTLNYISKGLTESGRESEREGREWAKV